MKFLRFLLIVLIVLAVFLFVAKDWVIKAGIEQGVTALTGFKTSVKSLKYDFPSTIHIKELKIRNPKGFEEETFASIPEIYISLVLSELLQGKRLHLPEVRLNVQEIHLEKNKEGVSNVELLSSVGGKPGEKPAAKPKEEGEKKPPMPFLLDRLELSVRDVSYEDRSAVMGVAPVPGKKIAVDLNLQNQVFTDITDPLVLVNVILMKILNSATFGKLLNINPQDLLGENLTGVLSSGQELVGKQAAAVTQQLGSVTGGAASAVTESETAKKAGSLVGDSLGGAKDQVSGLFGKIKSLAPAEDASPQKS
ncbi:MAG TPA: AsmA family protein [bacterium]|nr:AsmA family protein [bacterium]